MSGRLSSPRRPRDRFPFLFIFLFLSLVVIALRLAFIQGVEAKKYDRLALSQRIRHYELAPDRGSIYDRNGELLAISIEMDTVYATPYQVKYPKRAARKIAPILEESTETILKKLTKPSGFVYLARKLPKAKADKIRLLKIPGIGFTKESKRFYPGSSLAAHVLGFAGLDNQGLAGIELFYDSLLKGKPGELLSEEDPLGRPIPGGIFKYKPPSNGKSLMLTIDKEIQYKAEVELKAAVENYQAAGGSVIVMNPKDGDIYALANEPTFDLNSFDQVDPDILRNRALTDLFEPGSTMKIITAAAALAENLYNPQSHFYLPGTITVGGYTIKEAHERGGENFTFTDIVTRSSNVGAVTIGQNLGKARLYHYINKFGLTKKTGIDLVGESQGFVPPPEQWSSSSIGNIPFGQGISATAMEVLEVGTIIANKGRSVKPHFLEKIIDSKGAEEEIKEDKKENYVISPRVVEQLTKILEIAVNSGTGQSAEVAGYRVAGKTGTAQKPREDAPGYDPGKYLSSFIGFVPAQDPALVILVLIDEPKGTYYGGVVAAPVFSKVAEFSLRQLKIMP